MTYKKYLFCIPLTLLIGLIVILQPFFSVVYADDGGGSGYTGADRYDFPAGMRVINPSTDMDKVINYVSGVEDGVRQISPITVRDYLSKLAGLDSSASFEKMSQSKFFVMFTDLENGGASYIRDGFPKDRDTWVNAAKAGGLSQEQIEKVGKLYDSLIKKGVSIINGKTTYMYAGQGGDDDDIEGNPPPLPPGFIGCDIGIGPKLTKTHTGKENAGSISGAYSVYATLTPVKPKNFSQLSAEQQAEWERTHQPQKTAPVKTAFGEYLDKHRNELAELQAYGKSGGIGADSNYRKAWESFAAGAKAAAAQPLPEVKISTSDANQEGMNKGGAFTYTEMVKDATVTATSGSIEHSQDYYDEYGCVNHEFTGSYYKYDNKGKVIGTETYTYTKSKYEKIQSNKMIDGNYTQTGIVAIEGHDYKPSSSWQFISVRCNQDGFNTLVSSTGSNVIQNEKASSSAKSQVVNGGVATFYNDLGIDFYYTGKTCDDIWGCTIEPNTGANNDSTNNKAKRGDLLNNSFGAQSDGKTGSKFVMFRDNISRTIRNDVSWPKLINTTPEAKLDSRQPASGTYVILDKDGTPNKDLFNFEDSQKSTLINGNDLPTKWYKSFKSQENVFNWRASWASDSNKPHRMNIRYAYKPQVTAAIKTAFDRNGGSDGNNTFTLDIICPTKFNTEDTYNPTIVNQPKNLDYSQPQTDFDDTENSYLEVNFVKASAEQ